MNRSHAVLSAASIVAAAAAAAVTLVASAAGATPPPGGNGRNQPVYGNIVGSPEPDRATLGFDGTACTVTVEAGLGGGRFGAPKVREYSIPGQTYPANCPDMGVAVPRKHARVDDLVVTWFNSAAGPAHSAYVLRHLSVHSGVDAEGFPGFIGTQDFNGDGRGDFWESTDEYSGFMTFLGTGDGFVAGPASIAADAYPALAFGYLDNTPGTDIAGAYFSHVDQPGLPGSRGTGAIVVFGGTGARVLLENDPTYHTQYDVEILDANKDGHQDVQVSGGTQPPRIYLGDGAGHFALAT